MEAMHKTNMDAMMEQMIALVTARGARHAHQSDKVNTPPGSHVISLGGGTQAKKPRQKKALCPNCKCFVMHKPANCCKLEANKASRYPGWKSIFAAPATAGQGLGTSQLDLESAAVELINKTATFTQNYWSLLACQVKEQEETLETDSTIVLTRL
jgi:hypothetical protein